MNVLPSSPPESPAPEKEFTALDRVFGDFLCRRAGNGEEALRTLGMELIAARREGHSFIFLSPEEEALIGKYSCLTDEKKGLLVREDDKLYLRREFLNEKAVAEAVAGLLKKPLEPVGFTDDEIDKASGFELIGEQHDAVRNALARAFALISGGPGTGKSTVIAAVAELELRKHPEHVIRIAAPTGKAAQLLTDALKEKLPERNLSAQTLHTLFGRNPETGKFKYDREKPLKCDLLIVDECSMVPLDLAAGIFRGLDPDARVVLVGDHRQLESIGSGNVLHDLLSARKDPDSPLGQASVELFFNFRAKDAPGIQNLAAEIRREALSPEELCGLLSPGSEDCRFLPIDSRDRMSQEKVRSLMLKTAEEYWGDLPGLAADTKNLEEAFARFNRFRILTANRVGPEGCNEINDIVMDALKLRSPYAPGSALMVTQNSRATGLANGDTGLVFKTPEGGKRVYFGGAGSFAPHELPPHESAFATTVHKAQGSGFPEVFFLMPRQDSPLLTWELFYTALTRAAKKITIAGSPQLVRLALSRKSDRNSFLAQRIARFLTDEKNDL